MLARYKDILNYVKSLSISENTPNLYNNNNNNNNNNGTRSAMPVTETAQEHKENTENKKLQTKSHTKR